MAVFQYSLTCKLVRRLLSLKNVDHCKDAVHASLNTAEELFNVLVAEPTDSHGRNKKSTKAKQREERLYFANSKFFETLGLAVPRSRVQAEELGSEILRDLKMALAVSQDFYVGHECMCEVFLGSSSGLTIVRTT